MSTLRVSATGENGRDHFVLQAALDQLAVAGGGTVEIARGTYRLRNALRLRTGVHLVGEPGSVLVKEPGSRSALTHLLGYGHREFFVAEPEKFAVGDGVLLGDNNAWGFYTTTGTIMERSGDAFYIDRPFAHDYNPAAGGYVVRLHSLVEGENVDSVSVRGLILDGNYPAESQELNGCRGAGLFLLHCQNISVQDVEVRHFGGDAISFQQCLNTRVENCFVHHNTGSGLHPGSGSVGYVFRGNRVEHNGGCGLFYCLRTTHSLCVGNSFLANGREGISVGERDTDHIIRENLVEANRGGGIFLREPLRQSGDRLWIEGNTLRGNNLAGKSAEFHVSHGLNQIAFLGNTLEPAAGPGVLVESDCSELYFAGNVVKGSALQDTDISGHSEAIFWEKPANFPAVGFEAAPKEAGKHLMP